MITAQVAKTVFYFIYLKSKHIIKLNHLRMRHMNDRVHLYQQQIGRITQNVIFCFVHINDLVDFTFIPINYIFV